MDGKRLICIDRKLSILEQSQIDWLQILVFVIVNNK